MTLLVVSAGTYHYGFDRLMDWTERWLRDRPDVDAVVQHGTSRTVEGADNHPMMPHDELLRLYRAATVVVLQGGAGGIMDARQLGIRPIVVPRVPVADEVVDLHQVVFARRLDELGLVHLAEDEPTFRHLVDSAVHGALDIRSPDASLGGVSSVSTRLDDLLRSPAPTASVVTRACRSASVGLERRRRRDAR